jgi:hypothetical protein
MADKPTLEEAQQLVKDHPERYSMTNGTLVDRELAKEKKGSGIVTSYPALNPYAITPERSQELHRKRKAQSLIARIKGRIDAVRAEAAEQGIDIPDPDTLTEEELITANGNAERLIYRLYMMAFINAAKDGKNFRGLAEGAKFALDPFESQTDNTPPDSGKISGSPDTLMQLVGMIERERGAAIDKARAIEAECHT